MISPLSSELKSAIGLNKAADGQITLSIAFKHLPSLPEGFVKVSGKLDSAPLDLVSHLSNDENGAIISRWSVSHGEA